MESYKFTIIVLIMVEIAVCGCINEDNKSSSNPETETIINETEHDENLNQTELSEEYLANLTKENEKLRALGYCGDGICKPENNETRYTCCKDCGCRENFTCKGSICVFVNHSTNHSLYIDDHLNFSIEIPLNWNGIEFNKEGNEGGKLFKDENRNEDWSTIVVEVIFAESNISKAMGGQWSPIAFEITPTTYELLHNMSVRLAEQLEIKNVSYMNTTLSNLDAEEVVVVHPVRGEEIKQVHIVTKKGEYFYVLTYTSPVEYFNISINEFDHARSSFRIF